MRAIHVISGLVIAAMLSACGGDSSSGKQVKDQSGRTCTIPVTGMTLSCDATPQPQAGCSAGATACFVEGVGDTGGAAVIGPAAVCAACCKGNTSTSVGGDCSPIVCKTVDDCPHGSTKCENSACY